MLKIGNYFREKTVKLSDSYQVIITKDNEPVECVQCIGFTPPKILQWNEEVYKYGNTGQKFLIPKTDVVYEVTFDFFESLDNSKIKASQNFKIGKDARGSGPATNLGIESWFFRMLYKFKGQNKEKVKRYGNGFILTETYSEEFGLTQSADYCIDEAGIDINKIEVNVLNNMLTKTVLKYTFKNCKIAKVVPYEFDYQGEDLCKWTVTFTFDEYTKE